MGILIFGMHRSGTSAIAGILKAMGVHFGPEAGLMAPREENAAGYFEHGGLVEMNDAILKRLNGSWDHLPMMTPDWAARTADLREGALALLKRDLLGRTPWAFKDPRLSITLPFWRGILPEPPVCVICLRNPVEVARSLKVRQGMDAPTAYMLWIAYMGAAVQGSKGLVRHVVTFDRFFENPDLEIRRLGRLFGTAGWQNKLGAVRSFLSANLRHHRVKRREMLRDPVVPEAAKRAYLALDLFAELTRRKPPSEADHAELDRVFQGVS